jgi:ATP-dependent RNA helicase SUPV3L1/SUV3
VHLFVPALLRPEPTRWRLAFWAVWTGQAALPPLPAPGRVSLAVEADWPAGFVETAGFWRIGAEAVRIDIVDRLARAVHGKREGRAPFLPEPDWAASAGLSNDGLARLLRALGCRPQLVDGRPHFSWRGQRRPETRPAVAGEERSGRVRSAGVRAPSPFSVLADVQLAGAVPVQRRRS